MNWNYLIRAIWLTIVVMVIIGLAAGALFWVYKLFGWIPYVILVFGLLTTAFYKMFP